MLSAAIAVALKDFDNLNAFCWALNPVTLKLETTIGVKASVGGPGSGPVSANVGADYGRKAAKDLEYHTLVDGSMRVEGRDYGGFDSARWNLRENVQHHGGICRMLQVGVLLRRTILPGKKPTALLPTFRGAVNVTVEKGASKWSHARSALIRAWKTTEEDEAIVFRSDTDRVSGHFDIEKDALGAIALTDDIMYMSLHESFEEVRKERQDRKKKQRDDAERKKQEEEKEKTLQDEARTKTPAVLGADASNPAQSQGPPSTNGPPAWLLYVVVGMLGMYFWQQLAKYLGGN